ncbi:MAG: pentapeptide repeat-containing protein [Candidatus Puniceispirillum sp.]|nr:pentapeptide repeat-containing protein [Candidatus Puniceispirillum sp.]
MGIQDMQLEDWINIGMILAPFAIMYFPHNREKWTRSIADSNWILPFTYLILFLFVHFALIKHGVYEDKIKKWQDVFKEPHSTSIMIGAAIAPAFAILGLLYANRRYKLASEQITLQTTTMDQQRFYDAVKLLGDDREYLQLGALNAIRQICTKNNISFFEEVRQILRGFLSENTNQITSPETDRYLTSSLKPISMVGNLAFNTLIDILHTQQHQKGESEGREQMEGFAFINLKIDRLSTLKSIQFSNCDMRQSSFCEATLDDVVFIKGHITPEHPRGSPPPDLSFADFTATKFKNCIFMNADISGAQFLGSSGLKEKDLGSCFYSNEHPPKGLPDGLLLRFPYSEVTRQVCTPEELDQFLANHPHFTRHTFLDHGQKVEGVKIDLSKAVNEDDPIETLRTIMGKPVNT